MRQPDGRMQASIKMRCPAKRKRTSVRDQLMLQTEVYVHHLHGPIAFASSDTHNGCQSQVVTLSQRPVLTRLMELSFASLSTGPPAAS